MIEFLIIFHFQALSSDSGLGWIGLNKISSENTNTWIDKSSLNYTKYVFTDTW